MRLLALLVCDVTDTAREEHLKRVIMSQARSAWLASVSYENADAALEEMYPKLVWIDLYADIDRGFRLASQILLSELKAYVFLSAQQSTTTMIRRAWRLGVLDFLDEDRLEEDFDECLLKLIGRLTDERLPKDE